MSAGYEPSRSIIEALYRLRVTLDTPEQRDRFREIERLVHSDGMGSAPYAPTEEQARTSPLLMALAYKGGTEREAIEALFRESEERMRLLTRYAAWGSPPGMKR